MELLSNIDICPFLASEDLYVFICLASIFSGKLLIDSINDSLESRLDILFLFLYDCGYPNDLISLLYKLVTSITTVFLSLFSTSILKLDIIGSKFELETASFTGKESEANFEYESSLSNMF